MKNYCSLSVLAWLFLSSLCLPARADTLKPFDYYVLSLSWSPQFCASHPTDKQCNKKYGVVLHGLWPQYNKGYPQSCSKEWIPSSLIRSFPDLYPSEKLAIHEWQKHGTCSGLVPQDYLVLSQKLKQAVVMPKPLQDLAKPVRATSDQLKSSIVSANPTLKNEAIAFSCANSGRFLQEIYVCFDKTGSTSIACSAEVQRRSRSSCGQANFLIRSVR